MPQRLDALTRSLRALLPRSHAARHLIRHLIGWLGVVAASSVLVGLILTPAHAVRAASLPGAQGLMLRPGEWRQQAGSYLLPTALRIAPEHWPTDGWVRVTHKPGHLDVRAVAAPPQGLPDFLLSIALQLEDPQGQDGLAGYPEAEAEAVDTRYLRVPGTRLLPGRRPTVAFPQGVLRPRLDHAYALRLGDTPFTLTVHDGLRNRAGVPYGEGAQYVVRHGGQTYTWLLGQSGRDSVVEAVADLDGDGKPDFIVRVGGRNGDDEYLLLSSHARPGANVPTAELGSQGC
ncbi:MAG: FG-GAP repeat protein [Ramlibacter sp.]